MIYALMLVLTVGTLPSCGSEESAVGTRAAATVDVLQWEAERAVMLLGYDPAEVPGMVADIGYDLKRIREIFGRWIDFAGHRVHYPWNPYEHGIVFTEAGEQRFCSGNWPELDDALASISAEIGASCGSLRAVFTLQPMSPCVVARAFANVEGVERVFATWRNQLCDDPCGFIWPVPTDTGMDYMFEYRFDGDETSDPVPRTYYYFGAAAHGDPQLVGSYLPDEFPTPRDDDKPEWWAEMEHSSLYYSCWH